MTASTPIITADLVENLARRLSPGGLNRCQAVSAADLPEAVWLPGQTPDWFTAGQSEQRTLLLVGHGGRRLWDHLTAGQPDGATYLDAVPDPFDTFSVDATAAALDRVAPAVERHLLYPSGDCPVNLVVLGHHLGWMEPSPLGLGIGPRFGVWSAFRALWLLDAPSSALEPTDSTSDRHQSSDLSEICLRCPTRDCVAACPASAVSHGGSFDLGACFGYRADVDSACAETCLSRWACPVAAEHRYSDDQMAYHYRISRPPPPAPTGTDPA